MNDHYGYDRPMSGAGLDVQDCDTCRGYVGSCDDDCDCETCLGYTCPTCAGECRCDPEDR